MVDRNELLNYVNKKYDVKPEYPFKKYPNFCALKHGKNQKWFALIMNVSKNKLGMDETGSLEIVNVKLNPEIVEILIDDKKYLPAYHMNKEHWISVVLERTKNFKEITNLIDDSFNNTLN